MKIHLEADYTICTTFQPIYSLSGQLISVGLMSHFSHSSANVAIPLDLLMPQLSQAQRITLLQNQLNIIEKHHDFFRLHGVKVTLKTDEVLAMAITENEFMARKMDALELIELEINEDFPGLKLGKNNPSLLSLSERFALSLENYGSGKVSSTAVYDNLFTSIKLDKGFMQHNMKRPSFKPFINALLEHIRPHCQNVIVQGIEDLAALEIIRHFDFDGIQSSLFSPVSEEVLCSLIDAPLDLPSLHQQ
ncbi:EAL domain-containing protein [Erwinia psidii]|uniref:EAL domain-containing protein n=1 Tax=Erwinia psidii TaxID=69224 RepID=A0A3N6S0P5_9GAMM|nr:EAL domain-containing protein [Erwinia psidii]MCX8956135.1 EAL domain-containing protein [Erwinia psidii]MCX8960100.1 EAL domain-containing protein [Erwinia psidii]MCX8963646.1 EAL domain-containing protein [Erwinia psidii]RQM39108.1 EAL domain-containing protein [Erwinia psidii]